MYATTGHSICQASFDTDYEFVRNYIFQMFLIYEFVNFFQAASLFSGSYPYIFSNKYYKSQHLRPKAAVLPPTVTLH